MKLSELRPIVKELHEADWKKYTGLKGYRKCWWKGTSSYWQRIDLEYIILSNRPIEKVLVYYEHKAKATLSLIKD
jgi:hypothetical protein